jgi:hypothetical protein
MSRVMILTPENYQTTAPLLIGTAMTADAIIFETEGLKRWEASNPHNRDLEDGRFFAVLDEGDYMRAFTDPLGQDALFYYDSPDWIVSNSFFGLVKAARAAGKKLTLRPDVLACLRRVVMLHGNGVVACPGVILLWARRCAGSTFPFGEP